MKAILKFFILLLVFGASHVVVQAQGQEEVQQIKAISKYVGGNSNKVDQLLKRFNYQPPEYLKSEFKKYPALRKIRMAYQAAEKGTANGGKLLIEKFYESISQKYEAIRSEKSLQSIKTPSPINIEFEHPSPNKYKNGTVSSPIKKQILSISKYVENGGLGGARGVLKHRFGLDSDQVFDILSSSTSNQQALERGISIAKEPPSKKERIKRIASELNRKYEGARSDPEIKKIVDKKEAVNFKQRADSYRKSPSVSPNSETTKRFILNRNKTIYTKVMTEGFDTKLSKSFLKMKISPRGPGGILFGNDLKDNTDLGIIDFIRYIDIEQVTSNEEQLIDIEIVFKDGTNILVTSLYAEDVYAVHKILYHEEFPYIEGDGLGIYSIEPTCHPAIKDIKLVPIFQYCDNFPRTLYYEEFENDSINSKFEKFTYGMPSIYSLGWYKLTDVPLQVDYKNGELFLSRSDTIQKKQPHTFITLMSPMTEGEITFFYENVPFLTEISYEFHRLNEFARTFAFLRWAKNKGGKLLSIPEIETSEQYLPGSNFLNSRITDLENDISSYSVNLNTILESLKTSSKLDAYFITENSKTELISMLKNSEKTLNKSWKELIENGTLDSSSDLCTSIFSFQKLEDFLNSDLIETLNEDNKNLNMDKELETLKRIYNPSLDYYDRYDIDPKSELYAHFEKIKRIMVLLGCD